MTSPCAGRRRRGLPRVDRIPRCRRVLERLGRQYDLRPSRHGPSRRPGSPSSTPSTCSSRRCVCPSRIGTLVFPALALLFFVVPAAGRRRQPRVCDAGGDLLSVFAVMLSNALFSFGLNISENREQPWTRTCGRCRLRAPHACSHRRSSPPACWVSSRSCRSSWWAACSPRPRPPGVSWPASSRSRSRAPVQCSYRQRDRLCAALQGRDRRGGADRHVLARLHRRAVPATRDVRALARHHLASTPSREAREFVIWAVQGGPLEWWVWVGIVVWTVTSFALAVTLFRRDQGRRFR